MPCASPPWTWPSTSIGLMMMPQSSTETKRSSLTSPVSGKTSTTAMWVPNGKVSSAGLKKSVVSRPGLDLVRQIAAVGLLGDLAEVDAPVRHALDPVLAVDDLDVLDGRLQHVGGDPRSPCP